MLLIVHGGIGILGGLALALMGVATAVVDNRHDGANPIVLGAFFVIMGIVSVVPAVLQIIAGVRLRQFRSRGLVFAGLASCAVALFLCGFLGMLSVALMVWGLIVVSDAQVKLRFDQADARGG